MRIVTALACLLTLAGCGSPTRLAGEIEVPSPSDAHRFVEVDAGTDWICARTASGRVGCADWLLHSEVALGIRDGASFAESGPFRWVQDLDDAVSIEVGDTFGCARRESGAVSCFGSHQATDLSYVPGKPFVAASVDGLTGVTDLSVGRWHACAVAGGRVQCWGYNGSGNLGDGSTADRVKPVEVASLDGVVAVAAGAEHTCAVVGEGSVRCWGSNGRGQLGDGSSADSRAPVDVPSIAGAQDIEAGTAHTCAVIASGAVVCWGDNTDRQLGTMGYSGEPVQPAVPLGALELASHDTRTCLRTFKGVTCWGLDSRIHDLSIDYDLVSNPVGTPRTVLELATVDDIACGTGFLCAVNDGALRCLGAFSKY